MQHTHMYTRMRYGSRYVQFENVKGSHCSDYEDCIVF